MGSIRSGGCATKTCATCERLGVVPDGWEPTEEMQDEYDSAWGA